MGGAVSPHGLRVESNSKRAGEQQLVLVTDNAKAKRDALQSHCKKQGLGELMVPKTIMSVKSVPVLGTGKTDYVGVGALVTAGS